MLPLIVTTDSPDETLAFAERLGRLLQAGDVLALNGNLGAGKTLFAKGIAAGLDVPNAAFVNSPTFTLLQEHQGRVAFAHLDWYRLDGGQDFIDLGWEELLQGEHVVLVEWAERSPDWFEDEPGLTISIEEKGDTARKLTIAAREARGQELLQALK